MPIHYFNFAIFSVESRLYLDLAAPQPADAFSNVWPCSQFYIAERGLS